ncbi:major facilitator superfamily domain-containing protein [Xylaria bambusicola]|uniref:major facilitator superfamily domain-containing protein n=1 Tax=Xylaria bambusicola TaxID=326684 RepID=UPI002008A66B|nr:major facilitator superfamily domain-containing protein [Xylaria bambusicola]KAI0523790.1 major facilitator superfamily domain-containing protein [Xylaria bambusicola]
MLSVGEKATQGNGDSVQDEGKITNGGAAVNTVNEDDDTLRNLERLRKQYGATWDGPEDPKNPYNWSSAKKVTIGVVMGLGSLVTLLTASVTAAALGDISRDLGLDPATAQISFSIYFLGLAFGPLPIAAISETNGRRNIWIASSLWFILWNSLCPVGYSKSLMIAGRFLAALGASVGNAIQAPVMTDMFHEKDRGKSLAIAGLLPYLGPALGPILGGLVSQLLEWPWLFYIVSIAETVVLIVGILVLRETYTPVLLRRKAAALNRNMEVDSTPTTTTTTPSTRTQRQIDWNDFFSRLRVNMLRPFQLLFYRPVMHIVTLNMGLAFGIYTLVLSTFAQLWTDRYGQSKLLSSLHYIAISIGLSISAQVGGRVMDWGYHQLRVRDGARSRDHTPAGDSISEKLPPGKPEYRVPYMLPGLFLLPAGLFWYGWSAQRHYHWVVVDLGVVVFTTGDFIYTQALTAYILDEFTIFGASANAAVRVLSQVLGFVFPIFAPKLYGALDYGWGNSLLAFIFIVLAFPVPACLWLWGEKLRALGRQRTESK